jgi:hypothetical protein
MGAIVGSSTPESAVTEQRIRWELAALGVKRIILRPGLNYLLSGRGFIDLLSEGPNLGGNALHQLALAKQCR